MSDDRDVNVFRPHKQGLQKILGELEAQIMEVVWQRPDGNLVTVRDVLSALNSRRKAPYAYTTVMTVMGNLARKGLLEVDSQGQTHRYAAALTREVFTRQAVGQILDGLLADFSEPTIAHFARRVDSVDELVRARKKLTERDGRGADG
ncbi:MAG: BlaI/MecI/CopY family transcriptional regulator [Cyanobacteria bacterium REEB65]|nr:BlaI/MecI/CopY family transcriptional regulator [Cyanobacteria bacterium REEB65]